MEKRRIAIWIIVILFISLLFSCSDDGGSTGPEETEPEWETQTVTVPDNMQQSQDPMVQMAVGHINTANNMMNTYSSFLQPPEKAKVSSPGSYYEKEGPWTYSWSENNLTITLTINESEDDYEWTVVLDGTDGEYNYDNWTYIYATTSQNNSNGHIKVYKQVTDNVGAEVIWSTDDAGVFNMTIEQFYDTQTKSELISNPDGSGEVNHYEYMEGSYVIQFKAEWQTDGSGEWWIYDDNGEVENSGSWL